MESFYEKRPFLTNRANIVTAGLSVPKLHNSFENLTAFYYFDKKNCTLYTALLEQKLPNLT